MSNLPFKVDYAKSGRSKCHTTKSSIPAGTLRLAIMIKSRNFDGMQPNWNEAKAFLTAKTRRRRPGTTEEIDGFDDLRPEDQDQIEDWIQQYTGNTSTADTSALKLKQAVRSQSSLVWNIRDLITDALASRTVKVILKNIPIQGVSATDMVKLLAELTIFGVPSPGDKNSGCCGSRPLRFCPQSGRYVCKAPQAWGECAYSQSVSSTACQPLVVQSSKDTEEWLKALEKAGICQGGLFKPQQRLFVEKTTPVAQVTPATSKKRAAPSQAKKPAKKGKYKPSFSRACMDPECGLPEHKWHVLDEGFSKGKTEAFPVDLYDATLCMTDLSTGTNSLYKLQILVPDSSLTTSACHLWRVWGRVGGKGGGGTKMDRYDSVENAKDEFSKLFVKQTGNKWENRKRFIKQAGKFFQLDKSYAYDDENDGKKKMAASTQIAAGDPNSKLDYRVQEVVAALFDEGIAMTQFKDLKVDLAKMPLGKMTEAQLKDAYSCLTEIEKVLTNATSTTGAIKTGKLQQLSNQFYSKCPSTNPVLIDSVELLKRQVEVVDELINLHASDSVMKSSSIAASAQKSAVDEAYEKLNTEFVPLDPAGPQYAMLKKYVENTRNASMPGVQGWGSNDWTGLRLLDAFEINREGEANRFVPSKSLGNRRLLWHGSRISNYTGILSQGLRIAPPEAPVSGYRFGKGVYFADMVGKSANYCRTHGSSEMFVMACDVILGRTYETSQDMYMEKPQTGTHSTHALSEIIPNPAMSVHLADGDDSVSSVAGASASNQNTNSVLVPLGVPVRHPDLKKTPSCDVSEFIVYDQKQVQIRYLLRLTTNPSTRAADAAVLSSGGAGPVSRASASTSRSRRIVLKMSRPIASNASGSSVKRSSDDESDGSSAGPAQSVSCFIRLDREDNSRPSLSGLKVLNSRTFVEGLRLTVVRGDITESKTCAIVVPSDSQLSLTGMVGEKVERKAGAAFVDEVKACLSVPAQAKQPPSKLPCNITRLNTTTKGKTIRELATEANVPFLTPFYKVVKKEDVSATKDVICIDGSGAFRRGQDARSFIGMASGKKAPVSPQQIPPGVEVFVQSSSHNRKMPAGSAVLLETSATSAAAVPSPAPPPPLARTSLQTGEACAVGGHNLPASHVVFVVSPVFGRQGGPSAAEAALKLSAKNALAKCSELGLRTVTLPSIGSGRAGYDKGKAACWIIEAIAAYLEDAGASRSGRLALRRQSIEEVCFCLWDDESMEAYRRGILAYENRKK